MGSTALTANADQLVRMVRTQNGLHKITVGGRNKPDPFPFDEPVTIAISADEIKFIGTAADEAGELLADHLGDDEPTTIKELQEAMGEDAPTPEALRKALRAAVADGRAEMVAQASGRRGATYRAK